MPSRRARIKPSGVLVIVGGAIVVASSFAIHGFAQTVLDWLMGTAPKSLPPNMAPFLSIALQILIYLITPGDINDVWRNLNAAGTTLHRKVARRSWWRNRFDWIRNRSRVFDSHGGPSKHYCWEL